jgi:hypothetical protein
MGKWLSGALACAGAVGILSIAEIGPASATTFDWSYTVDISRKRHA